MAFYWTSDLHLGHENIIKHCRRPFASVDDMDKHLIEQWNNTIGPDDDVFILGDISHKNADPLKACEAVAGMHGKKHLIVGNHETDHDENIKTFGPIEHRMKLDAGLFETINPGYWEIRLDGRLVVMSHYGLDTWHDMRDKSWHLHGHSHGKLTKKPRRLDVGVDTHDFRPWSWEEIQDHFDPQQKRKGGKAHVGKMETAF
jgi:calcineurin-like phosphoesterase family protein